MIRCPSEMYSPRKEQKRNQIGRKFSNIFNLLLDPRYYEGTIYGQNFNRLNSDKTSKIYVRDPLEDALEEFCNSEVSAIRYLVGFTGMGKTMLLRNLFKVQDRDIHFYGDHLVIYVSFYYANLNADIPQQSVESEIIKYLIRAIEELLPSSLTLFNDDDGFWDGLYDYMKLNKPISIQNSEIVPGLSLRETFMLSGNKSIERKKMLLFQASEKNRLEYYASMLKYLLSLTNKVHSVYFIFDDIESKEGVFHRPVVEVARHLHSCFNCLGRNDILTKTIVSLRAYTFTNLEGNDRLTSEMRTVDILNYLLSYIERLFEYEKRYIGNAIQNLKKYQEYFGSEFLISPLLEGLAKNIKSYFQKEKSGEYSALMTRVDIFLKNINQYIALIFERTNIAFCVVNIFD